MLCLFITTSYSQTQTLRVNLNKDTIIDKNIIDSVKNVAEIKDKVVELQQKDINAKEDTIAIQEAKISKLQKATSEYLFNGKSGYFIFFGLMWVLFGVIFTWCMTALIGMKNKTNATPMTWNMKEFFKPENVLKRILSLIASFILAFALMVFFDDLAHLALTMFYCFGIGLVLDLLIYWAFKWRKKFLPINTDTEPKSPNSPL